MPVTIYQITASLSAVVTKRHYGLTGDPATDGLDSLRGYDFNAEVSEPGPTPRVGITYTGLPRATAASSNAEYVLIDFAEAPDGGYGIFQGVSYQWGDAEELAWSDITESSPYYDILDGWSPSSDSGSKALTVGMS
jgi:hypothetical protein